MSYLAMPGEMIPIVIVSIVFSFIYMISRVSSQEKVKRKKLEVIEKALRHDALDEETKRQLLEAVADKPLRCARPAALRSFPYAIGWIGLCIGIPMLFLDDMFEAGVITSAASFGLLSVPIAMREIETRRHA